MMVAPVPDVKILAAEHHQTTAFNRSWSDVNPTKLMATFGCTSLTYSFLGNPLFLAVARQQVRRESVSLAFVLREVVRDHGVRGLFKGCGVSVCGTVLSEMVYYMIIEVSKEKLPLGEMGRNFGAGLLADGISGPIWTPFLVVCQMQWVAAKDCNKSNHFVHTIRDVVHREGLRGLFKGTVMSWGMLPLSGMWWVVYENLKKLCYGQLEHMKATEMQLWVPQTVRSRCPDCFGSTTDNPAVNAAVGCAASVAVATACNPLYVVRTRMQTSQSQPGVRMPSLWILRDLIKHEGFRGLTKGMHAVVALSAAGGLVFGATYEGAKKFADKSD